jgi:tetratricopeptide (TPR) repeat protein
VREISAILERCLHHASLDRNSRISVVTFALDVSSVLRKAGAVEGSLRLVQQSTPTLEELVRDQPGDAYVFRQLSWAWEQAGKARSLLTQAQEAVDACRQALAAQRQAFALAPTMQEYGQELSQRYLQLGRKLCELGRLDEAEACFRERQALWPGDAAKHAEVLRELRKRADQVGEGKKDLSPQEQQERQRYLDLCARLEREGGPAAGAQGSKKRTHAELGMSSLEAGHNP